MRRSIAYDDALRSYAGELRDDPGSFTSQWGTPFAAAWGPGFSMKDEDPEVLDRRRRLQEMIGQRQSRAGMIQSIFG